MEDSYKANDSIIHVSQSIYSALRQRLMPYPHEYATKWTEAGRNIIVAALHLHPWGYARDLHPDEPVSVYIKKEDL